MTTPADCSVGSCQRHGRCMYLNHPRCPLDRTPKMTPADYAEAGVPVPEHMRGPWNGTLEDLIGRSVVMNVREFYQGAIQQDVPVDRCEACGETDATEGQFCEGCGCCQGCCNCTESDCDCDACTERRENEYD